MILPPNNTHTLVWTGFSVMLYIIASQIFHFPEPVAWAVRIAILFLLFRGIKKYAPYRTIDKYGYILTYTFILWLITGFLRGAYYAEGYWMWKFIINNLLTTLFYSIILIGSNPYWLQGVYRCFWKYYLPLIGISILLLHDPGYLNYLPYSTLLLFFALIPGKRKWILLGIVLFFFITQEQRNDMIKMLVASAIALSISYSGKIIPSWFFKCIHAVLLVLPIVLLSLGVSGKFNVFKMDEYIKGNYELKAKGSDGQYYKDNLKADTRTAIYENVFYTMNKYNAWITGRSPAFGDEGPLWVDRGKDETTKLIGRYGNEVGILDILLWYGLIGVILFFLMYIRASYLAIYKSRSIYMKGIGIYTAFLWTWSFIWEKPLFETFFMMNIIFLGVCFSQPFRMMTNKDMQQWVKGIFLRKKRKRYESSLDI